MRRTAARFALCSLLVLTVARPVAAQAGAAFRPPVDAPVSDPFRPPANPYAAGNRGIEYATSPGQPVWAAGAGVVSFAGEIAHERYVSVDHGGGLRTTYSFLADIAVTVGEVVAMGTLIGHASDRLHFGAILRGAYLDPAALFALAGGRRLRLVAIDRPWT